MEREIVPPCTIHVFVLCLSSCCIHRSEFHNGNAQGNGNSYFHTSYGNFNTLYVNTLLIEKMLSYKKFRISNNTKCCCVQYHRNIEIFCSNTSTNDFDPLTISPKIILHDCFCKFKPIQDVIEVQMDKNLSI